MLAPWSSVRTETLCLPVPPLFTVVRCSLTGYPLQCRYLHILYMNLKNLKDKGKLLVAIFMKSYFLFCLLRILTVNRKRRLLMLKHLYQKKKLQVMRLCVFGNG